jgi:hypothetical protein
MSQYGSSKGGAFNRFTKAYKSRPSIRNYVRLRRKWPDAEIEIALHGGIDPLFYMEAELQKYGFDVELVASAIDANPTAISELSLQLMEKMIEASSLAKRDATHLVRRGLAVPDKLINWLIACMLDALSWNDEKYIPRDLIVLIRERLGGSNTEYQQNMDTHELRSAAVNIGGQFLAQGIRPSFRMLAKILKVSPTTVMRRFKGDEFEHEIERAAEMFDENGKPRPFGQTAKPPLRTK